MISSTVEHGADMDIDMTAGLNKLKTTAPEPPVLEGIVPPEEGFTAVLDTAKPDTPAPENPDVVPALPWPHPLALPPAPTLAVSKPAVGEKEAGAKVAALPVDTGLPQAHAGPMPAEILPQQTKTPDLPNTETMPLPPLPLAKRPSEKALEQKADNPSSAKMAANMLRPLPMPASTPPPSDSPAPLPATGLLDKPESPVVANRAPPKSAEPPLPEIQAKSTTGMTQPMMGAAGGETAPPPLSSDMPFSLKIETQPVEAAKIPHAAPTPAPVANQISDQLPHLLNKAEKQTVELRLDPPELGRVVIHLTTHDQQVSAHVLADRADTVDLMRRHAELLTATLARAGFSHADLSFQQGKSQNQQGGFQHFQGLSTIFDEPGQALPAPTLTGLEGRLDIRL